MTHLQPPPFSETAVAFLQWGPLHEPDETYDASKQLRLALKEEARETRAPNVTKLRITEGNGQSFLHALRWLLETHRHLQVLYISAHGTTDGKLSFDSEESATVTYDELGYALACGLSGLVSRTVLVFGACFALAAETALEKAMPQEVMEILGFVATPSPGDVAALIAAVLKSDEELLKSVTDAAAAAANADADVAGAAEQAFDAHESRLARYITGTGGKNIRHLCHEEGGGWTGTTLNL